MAQAEGLTPAEKKSLTHGEFWIPERERETYRTAGPVLIRGVRARAPVP